MLVQPWTHLQQTALGGAKVLLHATHAQDSKPIGDDALRENANSESERPVPPCGEMGGMLLNLSPFFMFFSIPS